MALPRRRAAVFGFRLAAWNLLLYLYLAFSLQREACSCIWLSAPPLGGWGVRGWYKKNKVHCRNSWPLTIACHMKKNVKSSSGEAFWLRGSAPLFLLFLPCYPCWWCKCKAPHITCLIRFFTILLCLPLLNICKTLVQQGFPAHFNIVSNLKKAWITRIPFAFL